MNTPRGPSRTMSSLSGRFSRTLLTLRIVGKGRSSYCVTVSASAKWAFFCTYSHVLSRRSRGRVRPDDGGLCSNIGRGITRLASITRTPATGQTPGRENYLLGSGSPPLITPRPLHSRLLAHPVTMFPRPLPQLPLRSWEHTKQPPALFGSVTRPVFRLGKSRSV